MTFEKLVDSIQVVGLPGSQGRQPHAAKLDDRLLNTNSARRLGRIWNTALFHAH